MRQRGTLIIVLFLLLLLGCSKESSLEQETYSDQPLFYLNAVVDGLPISLSAGQSGYRMFTGYTVEDSVLHLQGALATDSPNFRNAFYIDLRAANLVNNMQSASAANTFMEGPIALADPSGKVVKPNHFDYSFFPDSINGHIPTLWKVADTTYYGDSCGVIGLDVLAQPELEVEMSSAGPLSCTPMVRHRIETNRNCKAEVHLIKSSTTELQVEAKARRGEINQVDWFLDGQKVGEGLNFQQQGSAFRASYNLKAEVQFKSGCKETIEKLILPGGSSCDINIGYRKEAHRVSNPHNLRTVEIRYYDAQGKEYSSWYPRSEGSFVIESLNSYRDSYSEHNHQRFSFSGDAILKSMDGSTIRVNSIFGIFALAHP